ncbi:3-carboxy-cis,cis-muconate cycloisomerase [Oceanicola granulosus HTCC2516]|uniref:3-carboxy-cis,cis-muconate cycloisomerase n=1 Tax=Oceanicola granulosus (strain ATCC BAA-861 / DSM 15982 / KCTC 12143 / HTCC2516) TaxID=314256 RepID=Q2CGJ7_OCEGH|nr:lyase family protein [Oceanicola granulosus]EAR51721.1 3-carboxy-cis,cis-muconate cycloisomerase [Oceanicola granulosus HTCC2516]
MAASLFDSAIYRDLVTDRDTAQLFSDTAEVRAMLLVEGALARAQGALGLIPETAAAAIHRASLELQLDPAGLAAGAGQGGVPVPALVEAFRSAMQAPEHSQWVHFGATSQDIMDTALVLRLRQVLALAERRLGALLAALARLAEAHAELPMAGRTWGQAATPTTFGAVVAAWGRPLLALHDRLAPLRAGLLTVSLAGAAGTLSAMGPRGPEVRARLAEGLGLADPGGPWHSDRQPIAELSTWATQVTGALAKMGDDLVLLAQTGLGEIRLAGTGGSSTMPQKQNPVLPALLVALAGHTAALNGAVQAGLVHRQQRDGAAWIGEWLSLPQICLGLNRALAAAGEVAAGLAPDPERMRANIDDGTGLIYAEALSFRLATAMPRPEAQSRVEALCARVTAESRSLVDLAAEAFPDFHLDGLFTPAPHLGTAPADARTFATTARTRAAAIG